MIKSWSTTQATVALSSGEAELYALAKGASQSLGLVALAGDMGVDMDARVHIDSSAALGITSRKGLGKLRHVRVQTLWVQDKLKEKELLLAKVLGEENVADLFTKNHHGEAHGWPGLHGHDWACHGRADFGEHVPGVQ